MKSIRLVFFCILLVNKLIAQELEMNEQDDGLRPSLLIEKVYHYFTKNKTDSIYQIDSTYKVDSAYYETIKTSFFNIRSGLGFDVNYQYRNVFTKSNFTFINLTASYHFDRFQLTSKFNYFKSITEGQPDFFKSKIEAAYYPTDYNFNVKQYTRLQVSWNMESWPLIKEHDTLISRIVNDISLIYNVSLLPIKSPSGKPLIVGGYLISYRPELNTIFYGYSAQQIIIEGENFFRNLSLGYGYYRQRVNSLDKSSVFKIEMSTELSSPTSPLIVIGGYSVNYSDQNKKNWEIGIILNGSIFSTLSNKIINNGPKVPPILVK
jgi:hypothetical protein